METKTLVCNKGNIILESYNSEINNKKAYVMQYNFNNLNSSKVNINSIIGSEIYNLIEKLNTELIEKIHTVKLNDNETDVLMLLNPIAKELGIKQKFILFRATKIVDFENNTINFVNKDLSLIDNDLKDTYLKQYNINTNKYENLFYSYGNTLINFINNNDYSINMNFNMDFQIIMSDDLPLYMQDITGLMFKKIFYNLKLFIDNINK